MIRHPPELDKDIFPRRPVFRLSGSEKCRFNDIPTENISQQVPIDNARKYTIL